MEHKGGEVSLFPGSGKHIQILQCVLYVFYVQYIYIYIFGMHINIDIGICVILAISVCIYIYILYIWLTINALFHSKSTRI